MPSLEGKKMFIYIAPKKTGAVKKSQQAIDREKKALSAKEDQVSNTEEESEIPVNGGLLANAKISSEALKKLKSKE